jgi:hypothetical protein
MELVADLDATLYGDSPAGGIGNGAGQFFFTGTNDRAAPRRSLVRFPIQANVPSISVVLEARLTLSLSRQAGGGHLVTLHRVLQDWGEGDSDPADPEGSGMPPATGDATWAHRFYPTVFWTTPGGDFEPAVSGSTQATITGDNLFASTPEMVADVQRWVSQPSNNFGWLLRGDEVATGSAKRFDSRQISVAGFRPRLFLRFMGP